MKKLVIEENNLNQDPQKNKKLIKKINKKKTKIDKKIKKNNQQDTCML